MVDPTNLADVRDYVQKNADRIRQTLDSHGVGVGQTPDGASYAVVAYVEHATEPRERPKVIDGIPVVLVVTPPLRPMG